MQDWTGGSDPDRTPAPPGEVADALAQVRELLFGETRRSTEDQIHALEARVDKLRDEMLDLVADLETRLNALRHDAEHNHATTVDAIGAAIGQLGATVQSLGLRRKDG